MNLVDNIDPVTPFRGRILHLLPDLPDIVYAVVGGGVDLDYIQRRARGDILTGPALPAGTSVHRMLTVDRFRVNLGNRGLAGAAGAAEQIRMSDALGQYLIFQSRHNVVLALHIVECNRAPLAVQRHVGHG